VRAVGFVGIKEGIDLWLEAKKRAAARELSIQYDEL
jgi:hypothetical protein